ncbi:hypothetical protein M9H77_13974 [Catharanthus roseus]|uniref:Uncharacterized protein n=1 Tax=Catharanthus roseus TaxID=4058 RepID=A0ACC0BLP4_CATRO|nr:hypothetical protein M9H77_13974 [Catharanthus roseus]
MRWLSLIPGLPIQKVVLFKCDWFDSSFDRGLKIHDKYKLVDLHTERKHRGGYDPFILSQQAEQVEIHERNNIGDEDENNEDEDEVKRDSDHKRNEEENEEFQLEFDPET